VTPTDRAASAVKTRDRRRILGRRIGALAAWGFLMWVLLTWTLTLEQLAFGAAFAFAVAVALSPLGDVAGPWWLLRPRRIVGVVRLALVASARILAANVKLAARIWSPRRPLASGMLIVPTEMTHDGGVTAVGLITSLIVDNQITDVNMAAHLLQYHAIAVPPGTREDARRAVNGPIEELLLFLEGDHE
jgi:multicomponent Na+:H+ antiporter subunit E